MKKIAPYSNLDEALQSLDNGGRFYKKQIKANDGIINLAEMESLGDRLNDQQQMILQFKMAISKLEDTDKEAVFTKFDQDLAKIYEKYKPQELRSLDANSKGKLSSNAIITGYPKLIRFDSHCPWNILFSKAAGNNSLMTMTSINDEYHVYEIEDEATSRTFMIGHPHGFEKLPVRKCTLGGVIKKLVGTNEEEGTTRKFLEVTHYI